MTVASFRAHTATVASRSLLRGTQRTLLIDSALSGVDITDAGLGARLDTASGF